MLSVRQVIQVSLVLLVLQARKGHQDYRDQRARVEFRVILEQPDKKVPVETREFRERQVELVPLVR